MRPAIRQWSLSLSACLTLAGCGQATRYTPVQPTRKEAKAPATKSAPDPLDPIIWRDNLFTPPAASPAIEFVHPDSDFKEWERLSARLWHLPPLLRPEGAASLAGLPPLTAAVLAAELAGQPVKIRVPLGLPDPRPNIPPDNPLTLARWELGRQLFFDRTYLTADRKTSCAGCHAPRQGFADDDKEHGGFNTPTLLNCVYNRYQLSEARADYLEQAVHRSPEDERESDGSSEFRHAWSGVIPRLTNNPPLRRRFEEVFGTPPTEDSLGKALAVFLRTLLCGDSLHDRALREQARRGGAKLEVGDYEKVLPPDWGKEVGRPDHKPEQLAREILRGYQLFHNLVPEQPTNCLKCHPGPLFTDRGFHNLGVGPKDRLPPGRLAYAPIGLKDRRLVGAFKTPPLRSLSRTRPYLHTGEKADLGEVVALHLRGGVWNRFLDINMLPLAAREQEPAEEDIQTLVLFLRVLDGAPVDALFQEPPSSEVPAPR